MRRSLQISVAVGLVLSLVSIGFCAISTSLFSKAPCEKQMNLDGAIHTSTHGTLKVLPCQVDALSVFILPWSAHLGNEGTGRSFYKSTGRIEHPATDGFGGDGGVRDWRLHYSWPLRANLLYSMFCVLIC